MANPAARNLFDNEILLQKTAFWVAARGKCFGPFDYQWAPELRGVELTYQGVKFGEIFSAEELFADLSEFQLPMSVCRVAMITAGILTLGVSEGECADQRISNLLEALEKFGYERFRVREVEL